jgi:hypothetical protein
LLAGCTFTHSSAASPDLFAFATQMTDPAHDVLCTIEDSEEEADQRASAMEAAFAPAEAFYSRPRARA